MIINICSDAQGMAKSVNDTLADILVEHGKAQRSDALKLLVQWMNDKRYLRDLVRYQKLLIFNGFVLIIYFYFLFSGHECYLYLFKKNYFHKPLQN
jgi:hypothetical protein